MMKYNIVGMAKAQNITPCLIRGSNEPHHEVTGGHPETLHWITAASAGEANRNTIRITPTTSRTGPLMKLMKERMICYETASIERIGIGRIYQGAPG